MKLRVRRRQLDPMKQKISDVSSGVEVNPRTGNIESDHQGRPSQSKNERRKNYRTWLAGSRERGEEGISG